MIRLKSYKLFLGWLLLPLLLTACPNPAPPDFQISVSPVAIQVHQGESVEATLRVIPKNGFKGTLTLSYQKSGGGGLPSGLSVAPDSATVSGSAVDVTLTVTASDSAELGKHDLEVTATQGKLRHKASFSVTVVPPAGTLDATFGTDGVVTFDGGDDKLGYSLAFGDGGAIYVLGRGESHHLIVTKFSDAGERDTGFATTGVLDLGPLRSDDSLKDFDLDRALLRMPDGNFLATGYNQSSSTKADLVLAKFHADGSDLNKIACDGVLGSKYVNDEGYSLASAPDGWLIGGMAYGSGANRAVVIKATSLSCSDFTAKSVTDYTAYGRTVLALSNGAFLAGSVETGDKPGLWACFDDALALTNSGTLSQFDGGRVTSSALDAEGRILLAGYAHNGRDYDVVVVRMYPDGTLDTSFDADGVVQLDNLGGSGGSDRAFSLAIDGEGRILVAGRTFVSGHGDDLLVLRLRPDGSLDPSFGDGGVFLWDGGHGDDGAFEVALDGQGRIVVTGFSDNGSDYDLVLLRLNP